MRLSLVLTVLSSSIILAACGGGSDGSPSAPGSSGNSGGSGGVGANAPAAAITDSNYVGVAQKTLAANAYLVNSSGVIPIGAEVQPQQGLVEFAQEQMRKAPTWFAQAPVLAAAAVYNQTENCANGGTLTVSVNDANDSQVLDSGDSVSIVAHQCHDGAAVLNGTLTVVFTTIVGNPDYYPYSLGGTVTYQNLTMETAQERIVGNGSVSILTNATSPSQGKVSLNVDAFSASHSYAGTVDEQGLYNYASTQEQNQSTRTATANGIFVSSSLDAKSVRITTTAPFVSYGANSYPSSGSVTIAGAAGSTVRVTALDSSTARLELDANGDGQFETNVVKRWSELF